MQIVIIGAGMAGLGAARALQNSGHTVTLFDKGASVGGRVGTRRLQHNGKTVFLDHGAQNVKSENTSLENELQNCGFDERVFIAHPVCLRDKDRVLPADENANRETKWTTRDGLRNLPHFLAQDLDVRFHTRVASLQQKPNEITVFDEKNQILDVCERVIVTCPLPQTADLLKCSALLGDSTQRIETLRQVEYSKCLSVLMVFDFAPSFDWYALLAQNRDEPLLWLANENAKCGFVPQELTALVAQIGDAKSGELWKNDDAEIVRQTVSWLQQIDGRLGEPCESFVKRWRYSQPKNPISFESVNAPEDRVLVCGDGVSKGRVTAAWDSGVEAARLICENH